MKGRSLTQEIIYDFKVHLISEERSSATVEKYIRDVKAFAVYINVAEITKETVINYKKRLQESYSVRSVKAIPHRANRSKSLQRSGIIET